MSGSRTTHELENILREVAAASSTGMYTCTAMLWFPASVLQVQEAKPKNIPRTIKYAVTQLNLYTPHTALSWSLVTRRLTYPKRTIYQGSFK
jgi:hypothetical protein